MSGTNNPYGSSYGGQMSGNAQYSGELNGASSGHIKDTTTAAFSKDVLEESRHQPVLVDFWAPWCGPCKQLTPVLEKAVNEANGRVKLVKLNIDDHPSIPGQLGIQSIPAIVAFWMAGRWMASWARYRKARSSSSSTRSPDLMRVIRRLRSKRFWQRQSSFWRMAIIMARHNCSARLCRPIPKTPPQSLVLPNA